MDDYVFELGGVQFGQRQHIILDGPDAFDPGTAPNRVQDSELEQQDARQFGHDRLSGPTWSWKLATDRSTPEDALTSLAALATAWRADAVRSTPGAVQTLRYAVGGRTRRVYGRSRRFSSPPENRILSGLVPITVDFVCADHLHYSDVQSSATISALPSTSGGFVTPLISPLTTLLHDGQREGVMNVGGDAATWPIITFMGPSTNPVVRLDGGPEMGLLTTIAENQTVVVDTRPWARTVLRDGAVSVAGALTRNSRLANFALAPGVHTMTYRAEDSSGTSRVTVAWRDASNSL